MPLISSNEVENLSPIFRGNRGHKLAESLMRLLNIDKVNYLYDRHKGIKGPDFASAIIEDIGVKVKTTEKFDIPDGAFITISNHPCGHLDGIALIDLFGHLRPDYKMIVNGILSKIENLRGNFISVTPTGNKHLSPTATSITGIKEALEHLQDGHPLGIFPAGAVSDFSLKDCCVRDREWQKSTIRFIRKARVPIIPVKFYEGNSALFYALGLISWRIRLLRLPSEVFNKSGHRFFIAVGEIITVEEQDKFGIDTDAFSKFLRSKVYDL